MKKILSLALFSLLAFTATAQHENNEPLNEIYKPEAFRVISTIVTVVIFMLFIITLVKLFFQSRLKNKIIEKGLDPNLAASLLQTPAKENQHATIKWFCILMGLGAGLMIVNYTQPLGIHSLGIMSFSIAGSFLLYYLLTKKSNQENSL